MVGSGKNKTMEHSLDLQQEVNDRITTLSTKIDTKFEHLERKLERFDELYARKDMVMALHKKTYDTANELAGFKVKEERDFGEIKAIVSGLRGEFRMWYAAMIVVLGMLQFILQKYL